MKGKDKRWGDKRDWGGDGEGERREARDESMGFG